MGVPVLLGAMGILEELGFGPEHSRALLIEPPDHVLAEAGSMKPRPVIASSVMTAQPATLVAWWPERERLDRNAMNRLHWMVTAAAGSAWVVIDPGDDAAATRNDLLAAMTDSGFSEGEQRSLSTGELAVQLLA